LFVVISPFFAGLATPLENLRLSKPLGTSELYLLYVCVPCHDGVFERPGFSPFIANLLIIGVAVVKDLLELVPFSPVLVVLPPDKVFVAVGEFFPNRGFPQLLPSSSRLGLSVFRKPAFFVYLVERFPCVRFRPSAKAPLLFFV